MQLVTEIMRDRVFKSSREERDSPRPHLDEGLCQSGRFMVMMLNDVHLPFMLHWIIAWHGRDLGLNKILFAACILCALD